MLANTKGQVRGTYNQGVYIKLKVNSSLCSEVTQPALFLGLEKIIEFWQRSDSKGLKLLTGMSSFQPWLPICALPL